MKYHRPVLLKESVDALVHNPNGVYVDVTFGGGGHSREILSRLSEKGRLYSFDQDLDALNNTIDDSRFTLINQNFRFLENSLLMYGITKVDGILGDLGVSSHQFDEVGRDEERLADIFYYYGELREARKLAREVVHYRKNKKIGTTEELKKVFSYIPVHKSNKFFAQIFQAIRIEVNQELDALKEMLEQSLRILNEGGVLVVISYHSLEDRLVKKFLKNGMFEGEPERDIYGNFHKPFKLMQSKAIIPTEEEITENSRARSAKMRVGNKI